MYKNHENIYSHSTFLKLKNGSKWVLREWAFKFSLGFRSHFLRRAKMYDNMGLKKGIIKILALKMLWKNVWVVSFYYHFKGFFGEKKGTTEWGEGRGLDFCVNLLARLHHIQLLPSTYFYQWHFLFALLWLFVLLLEIIHVAILHLESF